MKKNMTKEQQAIRATKKQNRIYINHKPRKGLFFCKTNYYGRPIGNKRTINKQRAWELVKCYMQRVMEEWEKEEEEQRRLEWIYRI